jgi:hypothetical protein
MAHPQVVYYREQAWAMLRSAHAAEMPKQRCTRLVLAMDWMELADSAERLLRCATSAER